MVEKFDRKTQKHILVVLFSPSQNSFYKAQKLKENLHFKAGRTLDVSNIPPAKVALAGKAPRVTWRYFCFLLRLGWLQMPRKKPRETPVSALKTNSWPLKSIGVGRLEDDRFLLGFGLFSGANCLLYRECIVLSHPVFFFPA